ncbi:hypothetical protein ABZ769_32035 [Streptomyces olivoreticuli]
MKPTTVGGQGPAIEALYRILNQFPYLPAADITAETMMPRQLSPGVSIHVHGSLADFESWREALGLDTATVEWRENRTNLRPYEILAGEGMFAGVPVTLRGIAPLAPAPVAPVAAAV